MSLNHIDCQYKFFYNDIEYKGDFILNAQNKNWNMDYSLNTDNKYLKLNGKAIRNTEKKLLEIEENGANNYTKKLFLNEENNFKSSINDENTFNAFNVWYDFLLKPEDFLLQIKEEY